MADGIHHPLALDNQAHVEIGHEYSFALSQRRHYVRTFGRHDRCHAATPQRFSEFLVRRNSCDLLFREPAGRIHYEAAAFQRVMADRDFDLVGEDRPDHGAWKLRNVNFLVLRHQRIASERIVMFPTSQRAKTPYRGIDDRKS